VFPDSWNSYDSLGDAYVKAGQKQLAIDNYKKSLELNPANDHAKEKLKVLETAPTR
jgi:predicted negative regulator of RcsB-dependent stress response